jgi:hypothetical protein
VFVNKAIGVALPLPVPLAMKPGVYAIEPGPVNVHPLAGFAVTVKARLLLQVKFICVVTVPRTGPGEVDGSIVPKSITPVEPPTNAHRA